MAEAALPAPRQTLSVSKLTRYLKYLVDQDEQLTDVTVQGEVGALSRSPSGHVYLTLKDASSQVSCVVFRREVMRQPAEIKDLRPGMAVLVQGFVTVYEPRGTFQIYVERLLPVGDGAQFQRFERLKEQLDREGLFAAERKRPLPPFPRKLALVTSPAGQAYHDVLHRLRSQYPFVTVIEAGVSVQGEGAGDEMAMAIDIVNRLTDADLILLVRGGGAPEELAAFNDERLARAIFASRIPVVTGIGHQTDETIADLVADRRAATPSLAAAAAVPDLNALSQQMAQLQARSGQIMRQRLQFERKRLLELNRALLHGSPRNKLRQQRQRAEELARLAEGGVRQQLRVKRARLDGLVAQLASLDPLSILARGYAVLTDVESGRVVGSVHAVEPEQRLQARVADGTFQLRVEA